MHSLKGFSFMYSRCLSGGLFFSLVVLISLPLQALETATLELTTVQRYYHLDGVVEASNRSTLTAQTSGQVTAVHFDVDDYVEAGQVLLELDGTEQQAALQQAEANLDAATAGLQDARDEHKRISEIFERQLVAKSQLDKADAALQKARASYDAARAALDTARKQIDYTRVTAPFAGIVTERHIQVGETAQPGAALMSGISLNQLRVVVDVPQTLIGAVREHRLARVKMPDGGWVMVRDMTIFPFAEARSNTFKVRLDLPRKLSGALPGMFVKVSFVAGDQQVLPVPAAAVVYRSEVTGVYVVSDDGEVIFRHIRVGHPVDMEQLVVLSGLSEGEQVALQPILAGATLKQQRSLHIKDD